MQLLICMYQKHYILIQSHSSVLLQFLAARVVPVKLPTPCINLTSLSIRLNFNDLTEISVVLCMLKSSPNLQNFGMFVSNLLP